MKLALVNLDMESGDPPLGLAYIASYVRKYGEFDDIVIIDKENQFKKILSEKPDIVGIGSVSEYFNKATKLAGKIKKELSIPLIIGGPHISLLPSNLKDSNFDIGVIGEGEQTTLELLQFYDKHGSFESKKLSKIDGIVFNNNSKLKITKRRELIRPLDKIPFPARDLLNMKYYLTPRRTTFGRKLGIYGTIISSRGCPYKCVFCASHAFWNSYRSHSAEHIIEEVKELIEKYKVDAIIFWDDLFMADKKRLKKIVELVEKEKINRKVHFTFETRANLINREVCGLLKKMNTSSILFGLELGSNKILGYLKNNAVTVEQNKRALKLCKEFGFTTYGNFIIGTPGESKEDIEKTLELMRDENLDLCKGWILKPYPGTKIWDVYKKDGLVNENVDFDYSQFMRDSIKFYNNKKMDKDEFIKYCEIIRQEYSKKFRINGPKFNLKYLKYSKYLLSPIFLKKILKLNYKKFAFEIISRKLRNKDIYRTDDS